MACGIGVCMTCVLPVVGEDGRTRFSRSCAEGPVFGGDRVRFADVGTAAVGRRRRRRDGSGRSRDRSVETAVDMSTSLGAVPIPSPVLTASGCSAFGRELEPFVDLDRHRRGGHQVGAAAAALGPADPAHGRDAERDAQLDRPAGARASTACSPTTCPGWPSAAPGPSSRSPAPASRTSPSSPTRLRGVPGRAGARGQHQLPERREPRRGLRLRPGGRLRRRRRGPGRRRPGAPGLRQAQPRRHRHRERRPRGRRTPAPTGCR